MSEQPTTQDVQAQNIALYRQFADGVGTGRLEVIDEVLAADIQLPTIADLVEPTPAGLKQVNQQFRASFPDLHGTIEQIFAFGDWVAARVRWTGTNTGEFRASRRPARRSRSASSRSSAARTAASWTCGRLPTWRA